MALIKEPCRQSSLQYSVRILGRKDIKLFLVLQNSSDDQTEAVKWIFLFIKELYLRYIELRYIPKIWRELRQRLQANRGKTSSPKNVELTNQLSAFKAFRSRELRNIYLKKSKLSVYKFYIIR